MAVWKKVVAGVAAAAGLFVAVLLANSLWATSRQLEVEPADPIHVDTDVVARRLSQALRFRTVWTGPDALGPFVAYQGWLEEAYPAVHRGLTLERIGPGSLLFTWEGTDAGRAPVLLAAHQDVVPVEAGTESDWTHPPWSGTIADGFVWGRGSMDDKASMIGILEAVEALLQSGFRPERTIYLAFGHDEEVTGDGAKAIAARLAGQRLELVLDEGLVITEGILPGVEPPVALIGITERGYHSLELTVRGQGGHSSMPPPETPIGILSAAVARLEADPFPAAIDGAIRSTFDWLAPEMGFPERIVFRNLWLFEPVVLGVLTGDNTTNASVRTTLAPTMFHAGDKENVLAQEARAVVNLRVHPRESRASAEARVKAVVDDPRVEIVPLETLASEPSPLSRTDTPGFASVQRAIHKIFPDVLVAPSMMLGASDGRSYVGLSDSVYRFQPLRLKKGETKRIHGTDERIALTDLSDLVRFYTQVLLEVQ